MASFLKLLHITELLCKQFEQGVGKTLHKKLVEKAATQRNWMEKWWLDKAYLETRAPLAPYHVFYHIFYAFSIKHENDWSNMICSLLIISY